MFKNLSINKALLIDITLLNTTLYQYTNYYRNIDLYNIETLSVSNFVNSLSLTSPSLEMFSISDTVIRQAELDGFLVKASVVITARDMDTDEDYIMFKGQVNKVSVFDHWIDLDCQGLIALTEQDLNPVYTKECTNDLGDDNCGVNLSSFTDTGTVTSVTSRSEFADTSRTEGDNHYQYGMLTFTSGNNAGLEREILSFDSSTDTFKTFIPFPYDIEVSDTYSVYRGCQKTQDECTNVFSNWGNNRAWGLFSPGKQEELQYVPDDDDTDIDEDSDDQDDAELT